MGVPRRQSKPPQGESVFPCAALEHSGVNRRGPPWGCFLGRMTQTSFLGTIPRCRVASVTQHRFQKLPLQVRAGPGRGRL